ncbi:unnamed protein product, partial [Prorocentrum cordatum]
TDAQFLIQATFGPTRGSLEELRQTTVESWVRTQFSLPAGSHREYYRKRVSSRLTDAPLVGSQRSRCAAGSRWHAFAFSVADVGRRVNVTGNRTRNSCGRFSCRRGGSGYVDGAHRSDIDPALSGNGLPASPEGSRELPGPRQLHGRLLERLQPGLQLDRVVGSVRVRLHLVNLLGHQQVLPADLL